MDQVSEVGLSSLERVHSLIRGDCLEVLPTVDAEAVDVVVTSPPCNLGLTYRGYDDKRTENDYLDWLISVAAAVRRVMKADASFFLEHLRLGQRSVAAVQLIVRLRPLFVLQNHITWIKSIATRGDAIGHFKPVGGRAFPAPQP